MRNTIIFLVVLLITSCTLMSSEVQKAPLKSDQAVVFDIDGTLTPRPISIFTVRDDAADAVQHDADNGYTIIYLSARFELFQANIPGWLKENNFPEGRIHVPNTQEDSNDHEAFKTRILNNYKAKGWKFVAAYGDSSSDFKAYSNVGIKKENVFALRREGETSCQAGIWEKCFGSWSEQQEYINRLAQP